MPEIQLPFSTRGFGIALLILSTIIATQGLAFNVAAVSPAQNESNVPPFPLISVTFDQELDMQSVGDSSFIVYGKTTGFSAGVFSYNSTDMTLLFQPNKAFKVGDLITVSLTRKIKAVSGEPLDSSFVWQFRTKVSSLSPGRFVVDSLYSDNGAFTLFAGDLDGDNDIDFATSNRDADSISVFLNDGSGKFYLHSRSGTNDGPYVISGGDFDGDGDIDLITSNYRTFDLAILTNDGFATFTHTATLKTGLYPFIQAIADYDGDGDLDICVANASESYISIFINNGDGTFSAANNYACPFAPFGVDAADFDNDGDIDIVETSRFLSPYSFSILANDGSGVFEVAFTSTTENMPLWVVTGDFNGDRNIDLEVNSNWSADFFMNSGNGIFVQDSSYYNMAIAEYCTLGDFNGDGFTDAVVGCGDNLEAFLNNPDGTFSESIKIANNFRMAFMAAADLDSDGDLDLVCRNVNANVAVLLNEEYLCGDANADRKINVADAVFLINYVFLSVIGPMPYEAGDANCSGNINVSDAVYLINYIFLDADAPCDVTLFDMYDCLY